MRLPVIDNVAALAGSNSRSRMRRGILLRAMEALAGSIPYVAICFALFALMEGRMSTAYLLWLTLAAAIAYILQYALGLLADRHSFIDGYATTCDLRLALADHLRSLSLGALSRRATGDLTHVLAETVQMVEELLTHLFPVLVGQFCVPFFMGALLFFVDWRLGLAALVTVPVSVLLMMTLRTRFRTLHRRRVGLLGEVSARLLEYVQGIRVIRSFNLAGQRFTKLDERLRDLRKASIQIELFGGLAFYSFAIALEAGFVVLILYGSSLVLADKLSVAAFIVAMVLSQRFYMPLIEATSSLAMVSYLGEGLRRIDQITAIPPLPVAERSALPSNHDIEFDDVHFGYEDRASVLSGISCRIPSGKLTAVVGPSGAGKSTLLHLVARFDDVQRGAIRIGGEDIRDLLPATLMGMVSMVFQDVYLFTGSIKDNIRLGRPDATDTEVRAAAEMAYCSEFIDRLPKRYETIVGEGGATLSGGERQRLSIARALLKQSPIILLDEATASVDPFCERAIRTAIDRLSQSRTVVVIAHRLETIRRADQILVLENGHLIEQGRHDALIAAGGCYARLCRQLTHNLEAADGLATP
jgi:ATP-binding cassette subfamily B protein